MCSLPRWVLDSAFGYLMKLILVCIAWFFYYLVFNFDQICNLFFFFSCFLLDLENPFEYLLFGYWVVCFLCNDEEGKHKVCFLILIWFFFFFFFLVLVELEWASSCLSAFFFFFFFGTNRYFIYFVYEAGITVCALLCWKGCHEPNKIMSIR